jgi:hypothetical protein
MHGGVGQYEVVQFGTLILDFCLQITEVWHGSVHSIKWFSLVS